METKQRGWVEESNEKEEGAAEWMEHSRGKQQAQTHTFPQELDRQTQTTAETKIGTEGCGPEMEDGKKGDGQRTEGKERDGDTEVAKKTAVLHHSRMGLSWLPVLFAESHLPQLCSKHHPYLMRPLQSAWKGDAGSSCVPPPPSPLLKLSPLSTFPYDSSPSLLLRFSVFLFFRLNLFLYDFGPLCLKLLPKYYRMLSKYTNWSQLQRDHLLNLSHGVSIFSKNKRKSLAESAVFS